MGGRRFKTAFILGAGLGLRLRPLTELCPKPLLEVGGRPIITYAMDHLLGIGIERFIVNIHHCPEVYMQKFPEKIWRGKRIIFRYEPLLLDTAGGLKNIEDLLSEDESILCYNGDAITNLPLQGLLRLHQQKMPEATMVLRSSGTPLNVSIDDRGAICDIRHSLNNPGVRSCFFASIYAVETSLLRHIDAGKPESIAAVFLRRITQKPGSIMGIIIDGGEWKSPDSAEDYENMKMKVGAGGER